METYGPWSASVSGNTTASTGTYGPWSAQVSSTTTQAVLSSSPKVMKIWNEPARVARTLN